MLAFDLNTSQLLKQVHIPHDIAVNATTGKGGKGVFLAIQAVDPINTMVSLKVIILIFLEIFYFSFMSDYIFYIIEIFCVVLNYKLCE